MTKAIIFDFDGVLGDTWESSINICRELNMDFTLDDFKDQHNGNVYDNPKLKFSGQQVEDFFLVYKEKANGDKLFPLKDELDKLKEKYSMFIISSSTETAIKKYFVLGKWDHYFEKIFGLETDKSKIIKFEKLFKDYNLKSSECVFVTDTLGDLIEGEKVGVKTLAVTWGYHGEMRLKKGNPTTIIHDFNELARAVDEI